MCRRFAFHFVLDAEPSTLAKLFGLVCSYAFVPVEVSVKQRPGGKLVVDMDVLELDTKRADLFNRKVNQLVETISASFSALR